jgi:subtilisin family serine protease
MRTRLVGSFLVALAVAVGGCGTEGDVGSVEQAAKDSRPFAINVALNTAVSDAIVAELGTHGKVKVVMTEIGAVTMMATLEDLAAIQALPYVESATPDADREGGPFDTVGVDNYADGLGTWDLDAINVTNRGFGRTVAYDGAGVYVAVLDTGLVDSWRQLFPEERIAVQYAASFTGGGAMEVGAVASQPNKWEHDQNSHGTHVTSTILGYNLGGTPINGVAPRATVIPVKVLNQNGSGFSSMIAAGIVYATKLKQGPLAGAPMIINMSLGGPGLDAVEKRAIDYATANGVILVAAAGNEGTHGMGYPGAYAPVISVAASGWVGEWYNSTWWYGLDVRDPVNPADFYITDFSSRAKPGQDLDVAAPGSWIVGPYMVNSGNTPSYYYLGGTSMASPHVAGIVALMAQKDPALTAGQAEAILEATAVPLAPGCRQVSLPGAPAQTVCWGADATGAGLATADAALAAVPE